MRNNVTIFRALIKENQYILSLVNFEESTLPLQILSAITINSGKLEIQDCIINEETVMEELNNIFDLGNAELVFTVIFITYLYQ